MATTEKLYSPVFVQVLDDEDNRDYSDPTSPLTQESAAYYEHEISAALGRERRHIDQVRGLMKYYYTDDPTIDHIVNEKVHSLFIDVEVHEGKLWGVATIECTAPLSQSEYARLKEYINGQYSDGFGEGFEQREIKGGDETLYVSLWSSDREFFIDTQREFSRRLNLVPEMLETEQPYTLHADIEHPSRPYESRIKVTFPTTPEVVQVLTDNLGFGEKVNIRDVYNNDGVDNGLSYVIDQAIQKMDSPQSLQEFNDLATKLHGMSDEDRDIFGAVLQSPWCGETLADIVTLTENLDDFDLLPGNTDMYGEVRMDMAKDDTADSFRRLENSENLEDRSLAQYILRLETCVDHSAYGEMVAKEDGGIFTDFGYLQRIEKAPVLEIPCKNGTLHVGDVVLSAPFLEPRVIDSYSEHESEEVFSSMVGTVIEVWESDPNKAIVDFTTHQYSDQRFKELDRQLGGYSGRPTIPGEWPPIDMNFVEMRTDSLMRITDLEPNVLTAILNSGEAAEKHYNLAEMEIFTFGESYEGLPQTQKKPSIFETIRANVKKSHEQSPQTQTKDKGEPTL